MQKGQLIILFTQYKKETIAKFDTFREIKPPNCICNLKRMNTHKIYKRKRTLNKSQESAKNFVEFENGSDNHRDECTRQRKKALTLSSSFE